MTIMFANWLFSRSGSLFSAVSNGGFLFFIFWTVTYLPIAITFVAAAIALYVVSIPGLIGGLVVNIFLFFREQMLNGNWFIKIICLPFFVVSLFAAAAFMVFVVVSGAKDAAAFVNKQ